MSHANVLSEKQMFKELCENDFAFFVRHYLKVVEEETKFEWNWHIDVLCHYCERVYYGDIQNLDINIPPRMMKSLIVTVLFPCWIWAKSPSKKIICASRSFSLATGFNSKRRDLILSNAYQTMWPSTLIRDDKNASNFFANYKGGFMKSASAGGKITGEGADFLLSDDLLDAMDAFSANIRESTNKWFSNAFYSRVQNKKKSKRININQRLHVQDPSGNIAEKHNYKTLVLPMVMGKKNLSTCDFVDPRKEGEYIFPARYGPEEAEDDKKALGSFGYNAQYGQNPTPDDGGIIKKEWIKYYTEEPERYDQTIITADLKFKSTDTADYVSFMVWGKIGNRKYLRHVIRGRWSYKMTKENFQRFCDTHNAPLKYIEDKANGPALISDLEATITGLHPWPKKGSPYMNLDKVARLKFVSSDFENGEVFLPKNDPLTELYVAELTSFTEKGSGTGNDDMVDTSTMALIQFRQAQTFFG